MATLIPGKTSFITVNEGTLSTRVTVNYPMRIAPGECVISTHFCCKKCYTVFLTDSKYAANELIVLGWHKEADEWYCKGCQVNTQSKAEILENERLVEQLIGAILNSGGCVTEEQCVFTQSNEYAGLCPEELFNRIIAAKAFQRRFSEFHDGHIWRKVRL